MQEESRTSDRTGQPGVESAIGRDRTEDELPREMGTNRGGSTSPSVGESASSRDTSSGMSSNQDFVSGYGDRLAEQADRAASYLRNRDLGTLVADAERFVRNQPTVAVGGAFALGLLAARFLKSSSRSSADEQSFSQGGLNQNAGRSSTSVIRERTAEDHL
jgi:hypothetical protein